VTPRDDQRVGRASHRRHLTDPHDRLGPLVDSGPFAIVRNPLYVGNIMLWVGFALTRGWPGWRP